MAGAVDDLIPLAPRVKAAPRPRVGPRPALDRRARNKAKRAVHVTHAAVTDAVRDPLVRPATGATGKLGRGSLTLIAAAAIHVGVLVAFVVGNELYHDLMAGPPAEPEPTQVAVMDAPEPSAEPEPEPEPVDEPLPSDPLDVVQAQPQAAPAPPVGISAESTVEGGDGPAYQVGSSLAGATSAGSLTEALLAGDKKLAAAEDLVMTKDAVDALPAPAESNRAPEISARARRDGVSGVVQVQFLVTKSGAVEELKILQATPPGVFDQAVLDTVPSWRFAPATYKGQPVTMRIRQTIRFDVS